jgi:deoxyribonuclease V
MVAAPCSVSAMGALADQDYPTKRIGAGQTGLKPRLELMTPDEPTIRHPWDLSNADAVLLQKDLAGKVIRRDGDNVLRYIAGVDAAYDERRNRQFAAAVILDAEDSFSVVASATAQESVRSAYTPGLLAFRELPTILQAIGKLAGTPDLIVVDGHGVAHPRRFGLACHLGVLLDVPTIGCGKAPLVGTAVQPGPRRGDFTPVVDRGETVGRLLRTQDRIRPVYVSVGHRVALPTACDWILRLAVRYRLPETTRQADQIVRRLKKAYFAGDESRDENRCDP